MGRIKRLHFLIRPNKLITNNATEKGNKTMTMLVHYKTKKELKAAIGQPLRYTETSMFGPEYLETGSFMVAHRPRIQKNGGREFFAKVTMDNGRIAAVE